MSGVNYFFLSTTIMFWSCFCSLFPLVPPCGPLSAYCFAVNKPGQEHLFPLLPPLAFSG
jgi:hypothetical protein